MVRSRVKLAYIEDASARRATFRKRTKGIMKKVGELSMLCDVQASSIIYGPYNPKPVVFPSEEGARGVIERYRNMPEYQQGAKKANQESFTNARIRKLEERLQKYQKHNYRNDMTRVMRKRMRGEATSKASMEDLLEIGSICEEKIKELTETLEKIKLENPQASHGTGVGEHVEQGVEVGNPSQGVEIVTLEMGGLMVDPNLSRKMEIAKGKMVTEDIPQEENMMSIVSGEEGSGQNIDHSSNMPTNPCDEAQLNELQSYDHQSFNWDDISALFPSIYDGHPEKPNN